MFERSKSKRRRRHRSDEPSTTSPMVEPKRSRSRSAPKRLLIPIWLLVASNFVLLVVGFGFIGSQSEETTADTVLKTLSSQTIFQKAIDDAAYVGPDRVSHQLQPIEQNYVLKWQDYENENWVKVLVWIDEADFQQQYAELDISQIHTTEDQLPQDIVTLVPQVKQFCQRLRSDPHYHVDYRLKQYLGLNPNHRYDRMVELWVPPKDLFRPCHDPETHDRFCQLEPPREPVKVKNIDNYPAFMRQLSLASYHEEGRPWARLGYTYDWAYGERGVGASEYMMVPGARFRIADSYSTDEYCQRSGQ